MFIAFARPREIPYLDISRGSYRLDGQRATLLRLFLVNIFNFRLLSYDTVVNVRPLFLRHCGKCAATFTTEMKSTRDKGVRCDLQRANRLISRKPACTISPPCVSMCSSSTFHGTNVKFLFHTFVFLRNTNVLTGKNAPIRDGQKRWSFGVSFFLFLAP